MPAAPVSDGLLRTAPLERLGPHRRNGLRRGGPEPRPAPVSTRRGDPGPVGAVPEAASGRGPAGRRGWADRRSRASYRPSPQARPNRLRWPQGLRRLAGARGQAAADHRRPGCSHPFGRSSPTPAVPIPCATATRACQTRSRLCSRQNHPDRAYQNPWSYQSLRTYRNPSRLRTSQNQPDQTCRNQPDQNRPNASLHRCCQHLSSHRSRQNASWLPACGNPLDQICQHPSSHRSCQNHRACRNSSRLRCRLNRPAWMERAAADVGLWVLTTASGGRRRAGGDPLWGRGPACGVRAAR